MARTLMNRAVDGGPKGRLAFFGELLVRLSPPGKQLLKQAQSLDLCVGGAEANVAIGLASLGHDVRMISRVPNNGLGDLARRTLGAAGVDCTHVEATPGRMGLYFLTPGSGMRASEVLYDREGSSFARASADDFDWDTALADIDYLHMSGITPALGPGAADLAISAAAAARERGVPIIFDGNYRARLWEAWESDPRAILTELISMADVLFGNHRDIALLLDRDFESEGEARRRDAAAAAFKAFPKLKVMASTARHMDDVDRHRLSARVDTPNGTCQTPEIMVSAIVDRIGAGDAFAAGVLHGLIGSGGDIDAAARNGLALTALKHSLPGDASLFAQADIDAFLDGGFDVRR